MARLGLAGAVLVLLAFGLFNAATVRPFLAGDESAHTNYALEVASGRLPEFDDRFPGRMPGMVDTPTWTAQHPPLYYLLVAAPLRLGQETGHPLGGVRVARLLTLLMAAAAVVLTARLAAALVPGRPALALAAAGGLALVPSFQQVAALVYTDALAIATTTAALVVIVQTVRHGSSRRRRVQLAATAAAAAATRASGLEVAALAALAAATPPAAQWGLAWRQRLPGAARRVALVTAAVVLTSGWFYARNVVLYGSVDGSTRAISPEGPRGPAVLDMVLSVPFWLGQYGQLWGYVTNNLPIRGLEAVLAYGLLVAVLAGAALALVDRLRRGAGGAVSAVAAVAGPADRRLALAWAVMGLHAALTMGAVVSFFSRGGLPFGRYFFSLLPLLPILAGLALDRWPGARRGLPLVAALLAAAVIGVSITVRVLAAGPPPVPGAPLDVVLGSLAAGGLPAPGLALVALAALLACGLALLGWAVVRLSVLQRDAVPEPAAGGSLAAGIGGGSGGGRG